MSGSSERSGDDRPEHPVRPGGDSPLRLDGDDSPRLDGDDSPRLDGDEPLRLDGDDEPLRLDGPDAPASPPPALDAPRRELRDGTAPGLERTGAPGLEETPADVLADAPAEATAAAPVPAVPGPDRDPGSGGTPDVPSVPAEFVASAAAGAPSADVPPSGGTAPDGAIPDAPRRITAEEAEQIAAAQESASAWREILLTPLRRGVVLTTAALVLLAVVHASLEGGATKDEQRNHAWLQALLLVPAIPLLAFAARRIVRATAHGLDLASAPDDAVPRSEIVGHFVGALAISLAPLFLVSVMNSTGILPGWLFVTLALVSLGIASLHFPFALASAVLRDDVLSAFPARSRAAWRAAPWAAKITLGPTAVFFGCIAVGIVVSSNFTVARELGQEIRDDSTARTAGRLALFLLHAGAGWAALATFRVAGMLVRDVPEIREVLE